MYLLIGVLISIAAFWQVNHAKNEKPVFFALLFASLTGMLCLRYGQGTDYFSYQFSYNIVNPSGELLSNTSWHVELGWHILMMLFKRLGCSFSVFVGVISIVMMTATLRAIYLYSPLQNVSLLLLYPTYYLTYYSSALRQGLVLSVFLGFGLKILQQKRYVRYYALMAVLTLFHTSAALLFILPILLRFQKARFYAWVFLTIPLIAALLYAGAFSAWMSYGYVTFSINPLAVAIRCLFLYLVVRMHHSSRGIRQSLSAFPASVRFSSTPSHSDSHRSDNEVQVETIKCAYEDDETFLYRIYLLGTEIYIALTCFAILSQRLTAPLKAVEILLIPIQLSGILTFFPQTGKRGKKSPCFKVRYKRKRVFAISCLLLLMMNVEMAKNIHSYIGQGGYKDDINLLNFPYISVFEPDKAFQVRNKAH